MEDDSQLDRPSAIVAPSSVKATVSADGGQATGGRSSFTYNAERVVGNGSFGIVYQAQVVETGETVAIKKVFQDKRYKNRELQIMKELRHPCVVQLKHAFYTSGDKPDELFLNVVMEFMSETVYRVLKQYNKQKQAMPMILVKLYTFQMCRALTYIHAMGVCHRDIKPQNLLVCGRTHALKLCDFGSAKKLVPGEANVAYICSRYYRAPELIFGATDYTTVIDTWSMGCVAAEMILGHPLFPGESGVDQLVEIIKVLGTPTKEQLIAMNPNYTEFKFPQIKPHPWAKVFRSRAGPDAVEAISQLLTYEPQLRLLPLQAAAHEFFDELKSSADLRLPPPAAAPADGAKLPLPPNLFNLSEEELGALKAMPDAERLRSRVIPAWYKGEPTMATPAPSVQEK